jgi:hypothetical protein
LRVTSSTSRRPSGGGASIKCWCMGDRWCGVFVAD